MVATAEPTTAIKSRFVWYDLMSTDRAASLAFFQGLLGWSTTENDMGPMGTYTMITTGDASLGGAVQLDPSDGRPSHFIGYIACEDIDDVAARVPGLGGVVAVPPMDIPDVGRFAVFADPAGAHFSAITSLPGTSQTPEADPPIGNVIWNELMTGDPDAAAAFYTGLFGWTAVPSDMPSAPGYTTFNLGDYMVAGLMKSPDPAAPSAWGLYFLVEDIDASIPRIAELGGTVFTEVIEVAEVGRMVWATDPTGAVFAIMTPE